MISGTVTDIRLVWELWRRSPLTRNSIASACGSGISSAVTIHGPIGQNVSMLFDRQNTPDFISSRWMSRAVMSLKIKVAGDVVGGLLGREELAGLADHHRQLELVVELVGQRLGIDDRRRRGR